jgi:hypothetical protein
MRIAGVEPAVWQRAGRAINQRERLRLRYQRFDGVIRDYLIGVRSGSEQLIFSAGQFLDL